MGLGEINAELVGKLLANRRDQKDLSLREAATEIGVSAPTLQRLEAGQLPNATTLMKLAEWLGVGVDELRKTGKKKPKTDPIEQIEILLRADADLDPEAAKTIANVARQIYDGFKRQTKEGRR
jgi:transcriptional regulator with XRE-family HTH domain